MVRTFTFLISLQLLVFTSLLADNYCNAWGKNDTYGWIDQVHVGDMSNHSTWNNKGYHDYSHKHIKCQKGQSYKLYLKPHMKYGHHESAHWGVWVDWDEDGYFSTHEKMYSGSSYHEINTWMQVPSHASYGKKRMRVAVRWHYAPTACGYYWYGDVHDYTIDVYEHETHHYEPDYCSVKGNNDDYGWIKRVQIGSIDNSTWWNGYKNFCNYKSTEVEPGGSYHLNLMPYIKDQWGWGHEEIGRWAVWVDWDQDGKFEEHETVVDSASYDPIDVLLHVPHDAKVGKTRMRVALRFVYDPTPCGYYWYGDVEDYCLIVGEEEVVHEPEPAYCEVYGNNDTYGYIKHVEFGHIDKSSGYGDHGYSDFTHYSTDVSPGEEYKLKLVPWLNKAPDYHTGWWGYHPGYWTVWIDFDHDGTFDDDEKVIWAHTKYSIWKYVKIPHDAKSGKTRMRVALRWVYWPKACGEYWYGEVEDYTINIGSASHYGGYNLVDNSNQNSNVATDQMLIAPNPANHQIQIATPNHEAMDLRIYHVSGQLIQSYKGYSSRKQLDISALPAGSYLAILRDSMGVTYQKKFIKQ